MVNCGAAMYIAPIGVVNAGAPRAAYDEAIAFALGHQQSYGLEAAGVMAACVAAALAPGATLPDVVEAALTLAKDGTRNAIADAVSRAEELRTRGVRGVEAAHALQAILAPYSPMGDDVRHGPAKAGVPTAAYQPSRLLSIEELPLALAFAVLTGGEFREAIVEGINSGRDTDSIGVMAGAILGALHGEDVIAPEDAATLDRANRFDLAAAADAYHDTALRILQDDAAAAEALAARRRALIAAP
jgi:ADP-ribosylglycohydrolase